MFDDFFFWLYLIREEFLYWNSYFGGFLFLGSLFVFFCGLFCVCVLNIKDNIIVMY